jgi:hypothetical protein
MVEHPSSHGVSLRPHRLSDDDYRTHWIARIRAKCTANERGCWVWPGHVTHKGYGQTTYRGMGNVMIHRQMYKLVKNAALVTEQFVCHSCDVRRCCNPDHLFLGTAKANNRDCGNKGRHHNGVKTHCKFGHAFTPENTYLKVTATTVMRQCLTCLREWHKKPSYIAWRREYQRQRRAAVKSRSTSNV